MVGPPTDNRDRLCHQHVSLISPPDEDITQQVPLTRPSGHPSGLISHREAEEDAGQDEVIFCADKPRSNQPERGTALVARKPARNKVDSAAPSETRFSGQGTLENVGAG
nr:unnamed protein product [Spirometra erinaceieuropaei]